ncbi:MAG TPA: sigma-70 family RNA polymerase sigma factor [Pirellulales bacterium]
MGDGLTFPELIARVRAGDEEAARELVRAYEPHVRRLIRVRLTDPGLKRQMDSVDICQSVLGSFFVRAALGQYDIDAPEQLIKLLATMARNKLVNHVDQQHAARRDVRRNEKTSANALDVATNGPTPSRIVSARELLAEARSRLTPEERYLVEQRSGGRTWNELATELGQTADALRVRLGRRLKLLAAELDLDGEI